MELVKRGKVLLVVLISVCLTLSFISFALNPYSDDVLGDRFNALYELIRGFIRFILECALLFFVFEGYKWAKVTAMVLFGLGALVSLITMFLTNIIMGVFFIIYTAFFIILLLKPVNEFFSFQREKRVKKSMEDLSAS
ncbi:MAG: hypothetical protein AAGU74_13000 [Bacillota bacterium]